MRNTSIRKMAQLAILIALILVMAFTPLGYLKIGVLSITFITIPVVIGAVLLGPGAGALLGFIFGMTSFVQCFGMDAFGTALMSINGFYTFIMCVATRTLMGLLVALIYRGLCRLTRLAPLASAVSCAAGPLLNTLFFMGTLYLFFHNEPIVTESFGYKTFFAFIVGAVTLNSILELVASLVIGTAICTALMYAMKKK